jgi:hypothetical protein
MSKKLKIVLALAAGVVILSLGSGRNTGANGDNPCDTV